MDFLIRRVKSAQSSNQPSFRSRQVRSVYQKLYYTPAIVARRRKATCYARRTNLASIVELVIFALLVKLVRILGLAMGLRFLEVKLRY